MTMKSAYVAAIRGVRAPLRGLGILDFLEARRQHDWALWMRSLAAIYDIDDLNALDLPWWSFSAIRKIDAILAGKPDARVFEWGSGASTLWLSRRAAHITSVEHDEPWYKEMTGRTESLGNVDLRFVAPDPPDSHDARYRSDKPQWRGRSFAAYVRAIEETDTQYDLIVIDGRARAACLEAAQGRLSPGGLIVFDNSGRKRYREAIRRSPYSAQTFRGLTVCLPYPDETTLLFAD